MNDRAANKTCVILMATYDDWLSIAHMIPKLDEVLLRFGLRGRVIVVDDSSDDTRGIEILPSLSLKRIETIDRIQLGSNLGNQRAMAVGVAYVAKHVPCDYLVVMDSDNEDRPEDVAALLDACFVHDNQKIIFADRTKRSEGQAFKMFYMLYKLIFSFMTGKSISVGNFCVIPGYLVKRVAHITELWNHFSASILRSGLPNDKIPTERGVRLFGQGNMNLVKLIVHAFSGFSIHADVMAVRIMLFASILILSFFIVAVVLASLQISVHFFIPGWTSQMLMQFFILFILLFCTSLILLILVLLLRMQPPLIPYHDYMRFIFDVRRLFPVEKEIAHSTAGSVETP
ncbi:MAG: glycosyltransferase [Rhodospirillales bacterium]|nr:glycosyltransferase [Rhodospirillales bacterium]